jgi:orotate phosphoribosyltransferase
MGLPFAYVRSAPKEHGMKNLIEGEVHPGMSAVVIEDLISTGKSSLNAVFSLREAGVVVKGMAAVFTYGFPEAAENFRKAGVPVYALSNYETLIRIASLSKYIRNDHLEKLKRWRENPANWNP